VIRRVTPPPTKSPKERRSRRDVRARAGTRVHPRGCKIARFQRKSSRACSRVDARPHLSFPRNEGVRGSNPRVGFVRFAGVLSLRGRGRAFPDRASTKHYAGRSAGRVAEADLVPVGVAIDGLAYSVGVSLALGGADVTGGDLRHERIEVVHEDRMQRMSGALGVFQDEDRATLGQVPNGLSLVREEGRLGAEQALLPWSRRRVVADADPGVEVECHGADRSPVRGMLPWNQSSRRRASLTPGMAPCVTPSSSRPPPASENLRHRNAFRRLLRVPFSLGRHGWHAREAACAVARWSPALPHDRTRDAPLGCAPVLRADRLGR
jgi:hypothetical protein